MPLGIGDLPATVEEHQDPHTFLMRQVHLAAALFALERLLHGLGDRELVDVAHLVSVPPADLRLTERECTPFPSFSEFCCDLRNSGGCASASRTRRSPRPPRRTNIRSRTGAMMLWRADRPDRLHRLRLASGLRCAAHQAATGRDEGLPGGNCGTRAGAIRPGPADSSGDPRADKLLEAADHLGISGAHIAARRHLGQHAPGIMNRPLPINVSGAIPAVILDAGWPLAALKAVPLLARTAGLAAHLYAGTQRPIGFTLSQHADLAIQDHGEPAKRGRSNPSTSSRWGSTPPAPPPRCTSAPT